MSNETLAEQTEPEGLNLIGQLITASMDANIKTLDNLYEWERQRRLALEVHIQQTLRYFDKIALGTTRQYENGVNMLASYIFDNDTEKRLAMQHRDYKETT